MVANPPSAGDQLEVGEASTSAVDQHFTLHRTTSVPENAGTAPIPLSVGANLAYQEKRLDPHIHRVRPL